MVRVPAVDFVVSASPLAAWVMARVIRQRFCRPHSSVTSSGVRSPPHSAK